jgi:hypothetical protein
MANTFFTFPGATLTMSADLVDHEARVIGKTCPVPGCPAASAAVLENRSLCLDHFILRCYESLAAYDGRRDFARRVQEPERAQLRGFLEECSTQALKVCLRKEQLSNLQRSRLLDVLLWAGELSEYLSASAARLGLSSTPEQRTPDQRTLEQQTME